MRFDGIYDLQTDVVEAALPQRYVELFETGEIRKRRSAAGSYRDAPSAVVERLPYAFFAVGTGEPILPLERPLRGWNRWAKEQFTGSITLGLVLLTVCLAGTVPLAWFMLSTLTSSPSDANFGTVLVSLVLLLFLVGAGSMFAFVAPRLVLALVEKLDRLRAGRSRHGIFLLPDGLIIRRSESCDLIPYAVIDEVQAPRGRLRLVLSGDRAPIVHALTGARSQPIVEAVRQWRDQALGTAGEEGATGDSAAPPARSQPQPSWASWVRAQPAATLAAWGIGLVAPLAVGAWVAAATDWPDTFPTDRDLGTPARSAVSAVVQIAASLLVVAGFAGLSYQTFLGSWRHRQQTRANHGPLYLLLAVFALAAAGINLFSHSAGEVRDVRAHRAVPLMSAADLAAADPGRRVRFSATVSPENDEVLEGHRFVVAYDELPSSADAARAVPIAQEHPPLNLAVDDDLEVSLQGAYRLTTPGERPYRVLTHNAQVGVLGRVDRVEQDGTLVVTDAEVFLGDGDAWIRRAERRARAASQANLSVPMWVAIAGLLVISALRGFLGRASYWLAVGPGALVLAALGIGGAFAVQDDERLTRCVLAGVLAAMMSGATVWHVRAIDQVKRGAAGRFTLVWAAASGTVRVVLGIPVGVVGAFLVAKVYAPAAGVIAGCLALSALVSTLFAEARRIDP